MTESLPIVLVPGLLASAPVYAPQIEALWSFGPVTVAQNMHTGSMTGLARDILALAPPRFALAGLSMGGYIALEMMRQAPQRIARLALLDTQARPDTPEVSAARRTQMTLARSGRLDAVLAALIPRLLHPARQEDPQLRATLARMAAQVGVQGYVNQQTANITRPDSRPTLPQIRCATLVLVGDVDVLTPPECAEELAAGIAGAQLRVLPECGHLCTLECPQAVNEALGAWLAA